VEDAQVLDEPVRERAIELQHVAVWSHAPVTDEIARVRQGKEILAGGQWRRIDLGQTRLQLVVERVACFLEPAQAIRSERRGVRQGGLEVATTIGIDSEPRAVTV